MNRGEVRPTLEAFKWLTCKEVLHGAALACRSWFKVSAHDELWVIFARQWGVEPFRTSDSLVKDALRKYISSLSTLAVVTADYVWIFDCNINHFAVEFPLKQQVRVDAGSSNVFMFDGSLLCTGGGGVKVTSAHTYRVTREGEVTELQPMILPRSEHGVVLFLDSVYVFGGWSVCRLLQEAEKWKLESLSGLQRVQWSSVGKMSVPRFYFNPCVMRKLVYICGGGSDQCETFNPQLEIFHPLKLRLPSPYSHHTAVAENGTLYILSDSALVTFRSGKVEVETLRNRSPWGNMNGVLVKSQLFLPFGNIVQIFCLAKSGVQEVRAVKGVALGE